MSVEGGGGSVVLPKKDLVFSPDAISSTMLLHLQLLISICKRVVLVYILNFVILWTEYSTNKFVALWCWTRVSDTQWRRKLERVGNLEICSRRLRNSLSDAAELLKWNNNYVPPQIENTNEERTAIIASQSCSFCNSLVSHAKHCATFIY